MCPASVMEASETHRIAENWAVTAKMAEHVTNGERGSPIVAHNAYLANLHRVPKENPNKILLGAR